MDEAHFQSEVNGLNEKIHDIIKHLNNTLPTDLQEQLDAINARIDELHEQIKSLKST